MTAETLLVIAACWVLASMAVGLPLCCAIRWARGPEADDATVGAAAPADEHPAVSLPGPREPVEDDLDRAVGETAAAEQLVQP